MHDSVDPAPQLLALQLWQFLPVFAPLVPHAHSIICPSSQVLVASAGAGRVHVTEAVEEVIAQHPAPPLSQFAQGSRLAARGPVHNALTASTRSHYPGLSAAQQPAEGRGPGAECDDDSPPKVQVGLRMLKLPLHCLMV